jgi:hypothetical protein
MLFSITDLRVMQNGVTKLINYHYINAEIAFKFQKKYLIII